MTITLIKGSSAYLEDCVDSLCNSELGDHYFPDRAKAKAAILEFCGTGCFLVAVDEAKRHAGFICYLPTGAFHAFPYLHLLVTSDKLRGQKVGSMMMDLFEAQIFKEKDKLFLLVASFNTKAKRFYLNRGYKEVGIIPSLYRKGVDEFLLMKTAP